MFALQRMIDCSRAIVRVLLFRGGLARAFRLQSPPATALSKNNPVDVLGSFGVALVVIGLSWTIDRSLDAKCLARSVGRR